ncbi:unnamed protein product [Citrullus colocynthis]|uniref:Uncharacterized protein n=1 Tax=Citrullus colocynthis TaxID=252529 RepID=A0ABP0YMN6_9ROSI
MDGSREELSIRIPTVFIQEIDLLCFLILKLFEYSSSFLLPLLSFPFHLFHIQQKPHQISLSIRFSVLVSAGVPNFMWRVHLRIYRE